MRLSKGQVNFDRFNVPYRIYGEGEQLLVCVSGVQQTMASWRTVVSYFAHDYRLLLFDMPGQGRSQILSGPAEVSIDEQVDVLRQILLDQDNPIKPIVIGASWGGIVVAILAARHPELVDKIILASFSSRVGEKLLTVISDGMRLYKNGQGNDVAELIVKNFGQHLNEVYKKRIVEQFKNITDDQFQSFYAHGKLLLSARQLETMIDLECIQAETLIINGANDAIIDMDDITTTAAQIPHCEIRLVPGVGHFLHNENDNVLPFYAEFLASTRESTIVTGERVQARSPSTKPL